ncbi:Condensin complex subunit 3 [Frankliniella fusca]|uniref:Condensin complex subunit 3 n=1 Tax=Frankliniella fusca TaxID=407009 RepID=A0AAE1GYF5_9NEOP|nr:Condensin complex subunit 3 [Frankliniella fusca]
MSSSDAKRIREIFRQSQSSLTSHEQLCKQLKLLYERNPLKDFSEEFIKCLQVILIQGEKLRPVENCFIFASKFIASHLKTVPVCDDVEDEEISPFALNVLKFLFENHNSDYQAIRFRVCQFINRILNGLGNEACIDDNLCDEISECMMERLQDKAPAVRMQAVLALHRLQDPSDPKCPVMKAFMFHMSSDPSAEVRRAIVTNIAITTASVRCIIDRTHDVKDTVRRTAFITISKLSVQRFPITQRVQILTDGLKDQSAIVRDAVSKVMLPAWLQYYKGSFLSLLHALDSENATEISSIALKSLFKSEPIKAVLEELTKLLNEDKVIPVEELSPENVLYWRLLSEYLEAHPEIADNCPIDEPLPELLPELSTFCNYIKQYHETKSLDEAEHWVILQHQYMLIQLLELCKGFDLADEMGRTNLKNLCVYLLTNSSVHEDVVPVIIQLMVGIVPQVEDRLQVLAEAISEVREPMTEQEAQPENAPQAPPLSSEELRQKELKQASIRVKINELQEEQGDAVREEDFARAQTLRDECQKLQSELKALTEVTAPPPPPPPPSSRVEVRDAIKDELALRKCLRIVREMTQSDSVKCLSATLRSLMQNFILSCLSEENTPLIRKKGLEVLGIFCLLDKKMAQENFFMFCFQIANDEVCEVALKVTFDLLLLYGLETFRVQEGNGEESTKKSKKKKNLFATDIIDDEFDTEEDEITETQSTFSSGSSGNASNLISMLTSLIDSTSTSMRNVAIEGLYKLLMACRITSSALLSRLILLWYSPVTEGDEELRQPLGVFLTVYASQCPRSQETLEQAFLPTLRTLMQAPASSPLTSIDKDSVARLFLNLTRPGCNKFHSKMSHIHNNLALTICNAILDCDDSTFIAVLLKALVALDLSLDDPVFREELKTLVDSVKKVFVMTKEKLYIRYVNKISQLIDLAANSASMRTTEVDNTAAFSQLEGTNSVRDLTACVEEKNNKNVSWSELLLYKLCCNENSLVFYNFKINLQCDSGSDSEDEERNTTTSNIVIPPSPPRDETSDDEEVENYERHAKANKNEGKTGRKDTEDVFKKPVVQVKSVRNKTQRQDRLASDGESSLSPVAKKKKTDETQDASGIRGNRSVRNVRGKVTKDQSSGKSPAQKQSQKITLVTVAKNTTDLKKTNGTGIRNENNIQTGKRQISPTEKGLTLKTFQNISPPKSGESNAKSIASPRGTPPAKRMSKSLLGEVSRTAASSAEPEVSEASSISSKNDSPARPNTRRSLANRVDRDSEESPPVSAASLRAKMGKMLNKSEMPTSTSLSASKSSDKPQVKDSTGKEKTLSSADSLTPVSGSDIATDSSSPLPPRDHPANRGTPKQLAKKTITEPRTTRSKTGSDESPLPHTRSGRINKNRASPQKPLSCSVQLSRANGQSSASDSESSLSPAKRKPLRSKSGQQSTKVTRLSSTEVESDVSPDKVSTMQNKLQKVKGINKLPERSTRITRNSITSQSGSEGTSQPLDTSSSDQSPALRKSRQSSLPNEENELSVDSPSSAAQLKNALLKKNHHKTKTSARGISDEKSEENNSAPSPARRSSRGQAVTVAMTGASKKRPLNSASSDGFESETSSSARKVNQGQTKSIAVTSSNTTPTQPQKKSRTKAQGKESPIPPRRSLRSTVETPSPRTRSGKI